MGKTRAVQLEDNPKRAMILRHAIETFAHEGFRHADVQVIADQAGVGKGTVYRYFGSKEELFNAATYDVLARLERHIFAAIEGIDDPMEAIRVLGMAHTKFFDRNRSYLEIFVQNRAEFRGTVPASHKALHEQMIGRLGKVVERGIGNGQIKDGDPRGIVMTLGTVLYGTIMFGCYVDDEYSLEQLCAESLSCFLRGILVSNATNSQG